MHRIILFALITFLIPATASAAGFEYPDNGARALSRGGAFVASGDDPTLIQYNPAGLALLDGFRFSLDGQIVWWAAEYQRMALNENEEWSTIDPMTGETMKPVSNSYTPWITPFLAASYRVMDNLTLALGIYGPSAIGIREYPDPRDIADFFWDGVYDQEEEELDEVQRNISSDAPQRYGMIRLFNLVAFPTLSVGWEPLPWLRLGLSGQLVLSKMEYSLALRSDTVGTVLQDRGPPADIIGEMSVKTSSPGFTGILGLQIQPITPLTIGLSIRPGFSLKQEGTFKLDFNDFQVDEEDGAGLVQTREGAVFTSNIPTVLRFGIAWQDRGWFSEIGAVYERLSAVDAYIFEPDIRIEHKFEPAIPAIDVTGEEIILEKNWNDSIGIRAGAGVNLEQAFNLHIPIEVSAGYAFEQGAIPTSTQNLDFISRSRQMLAFGMAYDLGSLKLSMAISRTFEPTIQVRDSIVFMIDDAAFEPNPAWTEEERFENLTMVTDGDYESTHTLFFLSLEGRFGR